MKQGDAEEKMGGVYFQAYANEITDVMFGAYYRIGDAIVPFAGFYYNGLTFGLIMTWMLRQKVLREVKGIALKYLFPLLVKENQIPGCQDFGARGFKILKIESYKKHSKVNSKLIKCFLNKCMYHSHGHPCAHAQNGSGYFNQAQNLFKEKNYYEASVTFEKYLATEKHSRPRSTPFAIEKKVKGILM